MNRDVSELFQNRLMEEEYNGLTEEEVRQIYIEETGKQPPATIEIYDSENYINPADSNGFNGTIIHLYDEDKGINQMYTITRGSELSEQEDWRPEDWAYNLMGIFVGQNADQYEMAKVFDEKVTTEIENKFNNTDEALVKTGLGHSLGGNLITLIQLTEQIYDNVHTTNAAPPTTYQLANIDTYFLNELATEYNIDLTINPNAIYDLDPAELEKFAEEYYEDQGEDINNLVMDQDFLNALSVVRGFIEVGNYESMNAYSGQNIESLEGLFGQLPDELIKDIQVFFAENYSEIYNNKGFDGFVHALTGINPRIIDHFTDTEMEEDYKFLELSEDIILSFHGATIRIPDTLKLIRELRNQVGPMVDAFVTAGLIEEKDAQLIMTELKGLEKDLDGMLMLLSGSVVHILPGNILSDAHAHLIKNQLAKIQERLERLGDYTEDIFGLISKNFDAHSLNVVLKALTAGSGKVYESGGVYVRTVVEGKEININLSSLTKVYLDGIAILESKESYLRFLKSSYERNYINDFATRKDDLVAKMDDMEENPSHYQNLLGSFTSDTKAYHKLTKITVHDELPIFPDNHFTAVFENMFAFVESEISKIKRLLQSIMDGIEQLFEKDQVLAQEISHNKHRLEEI